MGARIASGIAALLVMTASALHAANLEVVQINNFLLELRGGSGAGAWHIQYGTDYSPARIVTMFGQGPEAYFAHYNWLRRIDLDKGIVTGRWVFPGYSIQGLSWKGSHLEVVVSLAERRDAAFRTYDFDPENPQIPVANQAFSITARVEAPQARRLRDLRPITPAEAATLVIELENTARRDPFSPWPQVLVGYLYDILKNPESARWIDQGLHLESAHYSELLDISNFFTERGRHDIARIAFERGYAEFWRAGQDPRLASVLLTQSSIGPKTPVALQRELAERAYALSPWVEGAADAWERYGQYLTRKGEPELGALWTARAQEARDNGLLWTDVGVEHRYRYMSLVAFCSLAATVLFGIVLYLRYRPQRLARLDAARAAGVSRPGFLNIEYWRTSEKLGFLLLVAVAWMSEGYVTQSLTSAYYRPAFSRYAMRAQGLLNFAALENSNVLGGFERDLLLAIAYQRNDRLEDAERLYRSLPQFAESWNNLGVLLKSAGKDEESRAAFERALALRPDFPEAEWNLGKPARGDWVKAHEKYVPDKAMMTVPTRAQARKAFGTREVPVSWASILRGPLSAAEEIEGFYGIRGRLHTGLLIFVAAAAVIMLFIRPREVFQAPPRYQPLLELLFPGTSRAWGFLGGVVLTLACYFSSALWPVRWKNFYREFTYGAGIFGQFPLPFELRPTGQTTVFNPIPSLWWLLALLAMNAAVVLLWKWRRK